MESGKKNTADKRVRISAELENKILKLANTNKFSEALPTLEQAINMYQMLKDAQDAGSKFYEIDSNGEKYIVRFI
ncbi:MULTISPECIES: hypothetical protein [Vibrio]|uniref:hypothetical protein n=1 Tax=Vibrio TaxID=662 RepID=UPI00164905BB|nr:MULTISPECIES: hypothetical protein [Vibrio]EKO3660606.1 hypothetical protein [Vibrio metschnikovii]MBC3617210.1 hypothetical protein [Vibrio metschnikovii]MBC5813222.1 hypothetical protein [Vibrio metschnikovii]